MIDTAARTFSSSRAQTRDLPVRWFRGGIVATCAVVTAVLAAHVQTWPAHEDEALALFTGRGSLPHVLHTVIAERGGAPLHFLFAWAVVQLGGGLTALRAVSLVFAVASVPAIAVLGARLVDRATGLVAAVLASGSWALLFHGVYGRMYSLFLFTSTLSFIALLAALDRGGRRRFALWGLALLATLASHPYAVLVLCSQVLFVVLRRERHRAALITLAFVVVAAAPFWWSDFVLRDRFGVGVGGGGSRLGSPRAVAHYFWWVAGDFSAGHGALSIAVLLVALAGLVLLARRTPASALLLVSVVAVPTVAFTLAKLGSTASPEARHLIFALPFFATLLAATIVAVARLDPPITVAVGLAAVVTLVAGEVRWAERKTPPLFAGDPPGEAQARAQAAAWLAATARRDDVLLGYEPLFLAAWERNSSFSRHTLPRADAKLLASSLRSLPEPLGRGVWVLDASDTTNGPYRRQTISLALPRPAADFAARVFGPYLVIRTRNPLSTQMQYLAAAEAVMRLGRTLHIGDAYVNLAALEGAARRIYVSPSSATTLRSRSTISR